MNKDKIFVGRSYTAYQVRNNPELPNWETAVMLMKDFGDGLAVSGTKMLLSPEGRWMVIPDDFDGTIIEI